MGSIRLKKGRTMNNVIQRLNFIVKVLRPRKFKQIINDHMAKFHILVLDDSKNSLNPSLQCVVALLL